LKNKEDLKFEQFKVHFFLFLTYNHIWITDKEIYNNNNNNKIEKSDEVSLFLVLICLNNSINKQRNEFRIKSKMHHARYLLFFSKFTSPLFFQLEILSLKLFTSNRFSAPLLIRTCGILVLSIFAHSIQFDWKKRSFIGKKRRRIDE
jgi:hypothetical protein